MTWTGFDTLDLSGIDADRTLRLRPGNYVVKCESATLENKNGTRFIEAAFRDVESPAGIIMRFNLVHDNAKAQEIGLRMLKSFLIAGGHPNPDRPGNIASLVGLEVGVVVDWGRPFKSTETGEMINLPEIKAFAKKDGLGRIGPNGNPEPARRTSPTGTNSPPLLNDSIPF